MCVLQITSMQLCAAGKNNHLGLRIEKLTEAYVFLSQGSHVQRYVNICLFV